MANNPTLTGVGSPGSYTGVRSPQPPNLIVKTTAPTSGTKNVDIKNFNIGDIWVNSSTNIPYMLTNMNAGVPTWVQLASASSGASNFITDAGTATQVGGNLHVSGGDLINTAGAGSTVTVNLNRGTNGQIIVASTGHASAYATLTSSDGSITITGGANTLDIITAAGILREINDDDGGMAVPAAGIITFHDGNNTEISAVGNGVTFSVAGTTQHAVQIGNVTGSLTSLGVGANGTVLIGATGADPAFALLTSNGGTIAFTTGANTLNLESTVTGFPWTEVTAAAQNMAVNNGYVANRATLVTLTLPAVSVLGDRVAVVGKGAGGWSIAQGAGQVIHFNSGTTTVGAGGSLSSTVQYNCAELICIVANTTWVVRQAAGNLTIV